MAYTDPGSSWPGEEAASDCPNPACPDGRIAWLRWSGPADLPPLYAGTCDHCGQWAAGCPICGDLVPLGPAAVECTCELCITLIETDKGARIEIITADDARRAYAPPDK